MTPTRTFITTMLVLILVLVTITGCSFFTKPREKPLIEDKLGDGSRIATVAVDSTRRVVVVDLTDGTTCAEPPPDVAESVARAFAAAFEASLKREDIDANTAMQLTNIIERNAKQLAPITQGVKFSRDSLFALCQMGSNGVLDSSDFYYLYHAVIDRASILIAQEIPYLVQGIDTTKSSVPSTSEVIEELRNLNLRDSGAAINAPTEEQQDSSSDAEAGGDNEMERESTGEGAPRSD